MKKLTGVFLWMVLVFSGVGKLQAMEQSLDVKLLYANQYLEKLESSFKDLWKAKSKSEIYILNKVNKAVKSFNDAEQAHSNAPTEESKLDVEQAKSRLMIVRTGNEDLHASIQKLNEDIQGAKKEVTMLEYKIKQQQPQQSKQKIPLLPKKWFGIGATAAAVFAAGTIYEGLKWYQKKQIRRVLTKYELDLTMLSLTQRDAMAAAFRASYSVPGSLRSLRLLSRKSQFVSREVPAEVMWNMVAEIYYKKSPTPKEVQDFKIYVG